MQSTDKPKKRQSEGGNSKRNRVIISAVLICLTIVIAVWLLSSGSQKTGSGTPDPDARPHISDEDRITLEKLIGRWHRKDGGYVIQIHKVNEDGSLDAAYYNPKPIHISRANALRKDARMKVFIELRDAGYPGSTYTLTYDPEHDILGGLYFHAGMKQYFKVSFIRIS